MRQTSATRDDLRLLAMWLTLEEPQLRPVIEEALDTVERRVVAGDAGLTWKHDVHQVVRIVNETRPTSDR